MKLNSNFVNELFKICLRKKDVFELAAKHIKYNYLPDQHYKTIWKHMCEYYDGTSNICTIGQLSQEFTTNTDVLKIVGQIKKSEDLDEDSCIRQLEEYIKNKLFIENYESIADKFNKGDRDAAFKDMSAIADQLKEFKIKDVGSYSKIIQDFSSRYEKRAATPQKETSKVPCGIPALDEKMDGGVDRGDTGLIMAGSGVGKSYALRYLGYSAARLGYRVVHVQVEGTEEECLNLYDSALSGSSVSAIEHARLSKSDLEVLKKSLDDIKASQGEIFVKAFEQFDSCSMKDVYNYCREITDRFGPIDLLILDYLDEIDPGDGKKYGTSNDGERKRRESSAKKFKNICVEFKCAGWTATQSTAMDKKELDDPQFFLTRWNISEFKLVIKPFSYFITLNQTTDERKNEVMRIYVDKIRKYVNNSPIIPICTNYSKGRFYNNLKTIKKFGS